ncbi:MAG: bifunctional tetrahydrofolate synthase/dihydrofolate synthase [Pseudomonas sp.]
MNSAMDLAAWLRRLEGLHPTEIDMGLARVAEVASRLGIQRPAPLVFTVTGTNGKGSTCAALDSLLRFSGRRSGCYTSPHLVQYNERVSIDGKPVSDAQLCEAFSAIDQARNDISLTYFEFGTLAALWLFQRAGLDAVVLEVGLGGRLDAVNIVDADVAVVTSIGLDHADYLGDSRDSVGYEKAGILRPAGKLVCSETDLPPRFNRQLELLNVDMWQRGRDYRWEPAVADSWTFFGQRDGQQSLLTLPAVNLPRNNLSTALQAFWVAGLDMPDAQIVAALAATAVPGRLDRRTLEWQGQARQLMLDVGHNPQAAEYLAGHLAGDSDERSVAVFGLLADKHLAGIVQPLKQCFDSWAVAPLPTPRSRAPAELVDGLKAAGQTASAFDSIGEAITWQLNHTSADTKIIIFGSFFCVAEAILWLNKQPGGEI